ncbi:Bax inhibitor-1 family protein [Alphaproteobacteria bacterium endosymbiont of Tiliacea citrago]|uniref:Bax inhibitor-1 family protein n=1 Tax=Alphaproteobacteria bacterium endosymbiont of Tiliacea citrago TaxID=3077944 RepID=UPI00313F2F4D
MNGPFKTSSDFRTTHDSGLKSFYANIFTFLGLNIIAFTSLSYFIAQNFNEFAFLYPKGFLSLIFFFFIFSFVMNALENSLTQNKQWMIIIPLLASLIAIESLIFAPLIIVFSESSTILLSFIISGSMLAIFSIIGTTTSVDLSEYRSLFSVGIIMIILTEAIGCFLNFAINLRITSIGIVFAFLFIIAYDMQQLKKVYYQNFEQSNKKIALLGSVLLFLNFVILLQRILILLNYKKDNK